VLARPNDMQSRELSTAERDLIQALLDHARLGNSPLATSLPDLRVVNACECGCPSVGLGLAGAPYEPERLGPPVADMFGRTPAGDEVGVLLFAKDDRLSYLEIYSMSTNNPEALPTIASLADPGWVEMSPTERRATNKAKPRSTLGDGPKCG